MTQREVRQLIETWRKRLAPEWVIAKVEFEELDVSRADVERLGEYHRAIVRVSPSILTDEPREIERTIIHEITHLVLYDYADAADNAVLDLGVNVAAMVRRTLRAQEERAVERLAVAMVRLAHA